MDFSFWNYGTPSSYYGTASDAVKEWKELGFTVGFTFHCDDDPKHHAFTRELLDECKKAGIKAIVNDRRTHVSYLKLNGEKEYRKAVAEAEKEFGSHPAVFGWYVGDEPPASDEELFKTAISVVRETSEKEPFVNFFPCKSTDPVADQFGYGNTTEAYYAGVKRISEKLGIIAYDRYSQYQYDMELNFRQKGIDAYFLNLNEVRALADATGKKAWTSLLSAKHWYFDLDETSVRWQVHTAFACGMDGVQWYMLYQPNHRDNFTEFPVTLHGRKKERYYDIAEVTESFNARIAEPLNGYAFDGVWSVGKVQAGFLPLNKAVEPDCYCLPLHYVSGLVTRFVGSNGKRKYVLTNIDQKYPEVFGICYRGKQLETRWLPPGGNTLIDFEVLGENLRK